MADLFILYSRTQALVEDKQLAYRAKVSQETRKRRNTERNDPLLEELALKISYKALDLLKQQYQLATAARRGTTPLSTCSGAFTLQFGLSCKYTIYAILRVEGTGTDITITPTRALQLAEIDSFWHLERGLVSK